MLHHQKVKTRHWVNIMKPCPEHRIQDLQQVIADNRKTIFGKQDKNIALCLRSMMGTVVKPR